MFIPKFVLPFLCLASAMTAGEAFVSPAKYVAKINRDLSLQDNMGKADKAEISFKKAADRVGKDESGNVIKVPVTNIERNWVFDGYEADGEFSAELFLPENSEIKGIAFFLHGFSQYPVAYYGMLKEACESAGVAIVAVETGLTDVFSEALRAKLDGVLPTYILQRALSEDTKQCIQMIKDGSDVFAEYGVTKDAVGDKLAVMGHSMGGGLSFPVAADCKIDNVFVMAPLSGEPEFDSIEEGTKKGTPKKSMLLAGAWDLLAPAKKVKLISESANSIKKDSSVYVDVARGLHTGFQDDLVLFDIKLSNVLRGVGLLNFFFGIIDRWIMGVARAIKFLRTRTGQIDGSTALMKYFLTSMVEDKDITPESAEKYLDDSMDKYEDKFDFSYAN